MVIELSIFSNVQNPCEGAKTNKMDVPNDYKSQKFIVAVNTNSVVESLSESDCNSYYGDDKSDDLVIIPGNNAEDSVEVLGDKSLASDNDDSIIAAATSLLVVERKQQLAGGIDNKDDDVRSLNSFIIFPNPHKLSQEETKSTKSNMKEAKASLKKARKMLWNSLKDGERDNMKNGV